MVPREQTGAMLIGRRPRRIAPDGSAAIARVAALSPMRSAQIAGGFPSHAPAKLLEAIGMSRPATGNGCMGRIMK